MWIDWDSYNTAIVGTVERDMEASIEREGLDGALCRCLNNTVLRKLCEMEAKEAEVSLATLRNTQAS